ncbi:hypothetical protein [Sporolactobacillus pectinivorans]|uniref:hypothetical protein n=1 Tax=Sporolactobacillus pectinivorans TaxID=1591408 RepID=UPI000C257CAC|nr:hypothetical protein [Sporolactobacillus pectinivorans]
MEQTVDAAVYFNARAAEKLAEYKNERGLSVSRMAARNCRGESPGSCGRNWFMGSTMSWRCSWSLLL